MFGSGALFLALRIQEKWACVTFKESRFSAGTRYPGHFASSPCSPHLRSALSVVLRYVVSVCLYHCPCVTLLVFQSILLLT